MYIARILYPVKVLGPGNRIGIWMCGCKHACPGCCNPELWDFNPKYKVSPEIIFNMINNISKSHRVDGFTISGGDPFLQPDALRELLPEMRKISTDILVYSGYKIDTLRRDYPDILKMITVLIDGKYIESRNNNCFLRGSDNQTINILDPEYKDFYEKYIEGAENQVQSFRTSEGFISVGIFKANYKQDLAKELAKRGIIVE